MFGCAKKGRIRRSRLLFRDMTLPDKSMEELQEVGVYSATEVKYENTINRLTAVANPQQIERVIRGCKFNVNILYDASAPDKAEEDIALLAEGMKLLEYDYLGGHGSRGHGKVKFSRLRIRTAVGENDGTLLEKCQKLLDGV